MNEWPAAVWASVSAMMAALVLSTIFLLGSFAREAVQIQQVDDNAIAIVKDYRQYSHYDGTYNLVSADVINAISQFNGFPEIWVDIYLGTGEDFYVWKDLGGSDDTPKELFSTAFLSEFFKDYALARYSAHLERDGNGVVSKIIFYRWGDVPNNG
ncbi:hypothetical protein ACFQZE_10920 [Paenibacillus sp. GCM10027627]|uniref:hypothetical protein n=1 Tax=unclassified Paenibacillus TaxID=185978 RepID=UPI003632DBBF